MAVLDVDNLHVFYGNIHALRGLSLQVDTDEIVTLIGANGAGKTTTLNAICSILAPAEGEVRFEGEVLTYVSPHDVVGRGIVQIPEGRRIFGRLTVGENLRMGAFLRTDKQRFGRARSTCSPCSRCCANASGRLRARCPAASSRCWRWRAV